MEEDCPVCMEPVSATQVRERFEVTDASQQYVMRCDNGHGTCFSCVLQLQEAEPACPMCRAPYAKAHFPEWWYEIHAKQMRTLHDLKNQIESLEFTLRQQPSQMIHVQLPPVASLLQMPTSQAHFNQLLDHILGGAAAAAAAPRQIHDEDEEEDEDEDEVEEEDEKDEDYQPA